MSMCVHVRIGMLSHDNTDVSLAAVALLQELTDPAAFETNDDEDDDDDAEHAKSSSSSSIAVKADPRVLIDDLLHHQALELLVQNLSRLDESKEEDATGVHDTLNVVRETALSTCSSSPYSS